jgi:DNA-directed RNA polymerase subunit M/transcription elongation factor TFIIS
MSVACVLLKQNGDIEAASIPGCGGKKPTPITQDILISKVLKKKLPASSTGLGILGSFAWKQKTLFMLGFVEPITSASSKKKKAAEEDTSENQHHLPPPLEGMTFYDDILVVASDMKTSFAKPVPFTVADYEAFYTGRMEGEEDDMEEDAEQEQEQEPVDDIDGTNEEALAEDDEEEEVDYDDEEEEEAEGEWEEDGEAEGEAEEAPTVTARATRQQRRAEIKKKSATHSALPFLATIATDPELGAESTRPGDIAEPQHPLRKRVVQAIATLFGSVRPKMDRVTQILFERLLWNFTMEWCDRKKIRRSWQTIGFKDIYLSICRRVISNLSPTSYVKNEYLWRAWSNREITLEEIVKKNNYELFPEHWQNLIDQQAKREQIQLEGDRSRATDRFQCNRCGKKETTYYELQTRSADEPMTIFINCLNCGKRWTQ